MKEKQQNHNSSAMRRLSGLISDKTDPALMGVSAEKIAGFLEHVGSSAQRASDADGRPIIRWQDKVIEHEIPVGSSVLDLGCGEGELLCRLMDMKQVRGQGVELDPESVLACVAAGVPVFQTDLDAGLKGFPDSNFDYVILEETLQTLHRPDMILADMLRVGQRGIVSFPNFGYWRVRLDLGVRGRMPVTEWLPHRWYDTPNIHLFTLQDFLDWAEEAGVKVVEGYVLDDGQVRNLRHDDNLYAEEALLVLEQE